MGLTAHLPSLAELRLDTADVAPTGMEAPASRRRRVDSPPAPPPPPLRLTGLPRDVIDVMVTQAALSARNAADPAQAICEWMGQFCKAAKVQGVAGCEDRWYMLALQTFGVPPAERKPSYVHGTWRELFAQVCSMDWEIFTVVHAEFMEWNLVPSPEEVAEVQRGLEWDVPRPLLDQALGTVVRHIHFPDRGPEDQTPWDQVAMLGQQDWDLWMRGQDPVNNKEMRFYALAALLMLKGACVVPNAASPLDQELYDSMDQFVHGTILKAEAFDRMRDALDRGAQLNTIGTMTSVLGRKMDIMQAALATGDGDIINLLFSWGWARKCASVLRPWTTKALMARTLYPHRPAMGLPWSVDEATTRRLIDAMRPWVEYDRESVRANHGGDIGYSRSFGMLSEIVRNGDAGVQFVDGSRNPYKAQWIALLLEPGQTLADVREQDAQLQARADAREQAMLAELDDGEW